MFGAGVVYRLGDRLLLRADIRDYLYSVSSFGDMTRATLMLRRGGESRVNDISMTAGMMWRF